MKNQAVGIVDFVDPFESAAAQRVDDQSLAHCRADAVAASKASNGNAVKKRKGGSEAAERIEHLAYGVCQARLGNEPGALWRDTVTDCTNERRRIGHIVKQIETDRHIERTFQRAGIADFEPDVP